MLKHRTHVSMAAATLVGALFTSVTTAGSASATYPGEDGRLYFGNFDLAAGGTADVYSVRPSGAGLRQLTEAKTKRDICPAISADGKRVALCSDRTGNYEIWTMDRDGRRLRQLTRLGRFATFPDWSPGGRLIAFDVSEPGAPNQVGRIWGVDARSGRTRQLVPSPAEDGTWGDHQPVWSPDGRSVVFVRQRYQELPDGSLAAVEGQLWRYDLRSRTSEQLTFDATVKDQVPDWSPNGRWIAYGADNDVWVMRANGSHQRNLTSTPDVVEFGAAWSPQGRHIAFTGGGPDVPEGERYVQVIRPDGSHRRVVAPTPGLAQAVPGWQPLPRHH